jgi:chromosome segregation ATPase
MAGQHQRMTDYMNDVVVTSGIGGNEPSIRYAELQENVSDATKTVMMLSDSLIELSAQVANGEERLQNFQVDREKAEADLRKHMFELTEQLMTSAQQLQRQQELQAMSVQDLQQQQETSESRLHTDLVALTDQVSALQQALKDARSAQDLTATAQREFLIDEQRAIVEAQRAALTDLQEQLNELRGSLAGLQDYKITRSRKTEG